MKNDNPLQDLIDRRLAGDGGQLPDDPRSRELYPTLWSFLTRRDVDGNLAKDPAIITIRLGLGTWLVELTDPTLEVGLTCVVTELAEALRQLEEAVCNPRAPWRPWKGSEGKFRARSKRSVPTKDGKG